MRPHCLARGYCTGEWEAGRDQAGVYSFGLVKNQHCTPMGVRYNSNTGLALLTDTACFDETQKALKLF